MFITSKNEIRYPVQVKLGGFGEENYIVIYKYSFLSYFTYSFSKNVLSKRHCCLYKKNLLKILLIFPS
jgi:hypothetical protein